MSIISFEFSFFVIVVFCLYYFLPRKYRLFVLLVASLLYFYAQKEQLVIIVVSTLLDYYLVQKIIKSEHQPARKKLLILGLIHNIGLLLLSKSLPFWNMDEIFVTSIGFSFFVITKLGFLLDAYSQRVLSTLGLGLFSTFSVLFLTISSGPIERAKHLLPQLMQPQGVDYTNIVLGLRRILLGFFKKIIIADSLSGLVSVVYDQPEGFSGVFLFIATIFFAFQLYADFSGYTDIVIGVGKLFGLDLFENFRQPYFSVSILDFWRRWHTSLTNWIRDFMFFPLTRYLLEKKFRIPNIAIQAFVYLTVMSIVGLWHGLSINFLIWGCLHGVYMSMDALIPPKMKAALEKPSLYVGRVIGTFLMVCFGWIWFRATSFQDAWYIATHLFKAGNLFQDAQTFSQYALVWGFVCIVLMLMLDFAERSEKLENLIGKAPIVARWAFYYALFVPVFLKMFTHSIVSDFVYFRF